MELLRGFQSHRDSIAERIQALLNARRDATESDGGLLSRRFEDCFFSAPELSSGQRGLRGQLQAAHWAEGFTPRAMPGVHNDLIDPAQMIVRGAHLWQQTR